MQRAFLLLMIASLVVFGVFPTRARAADTVTLQLKWRHQFQFAGYYAAHELGYYAAAGLEVDIRPSMPGLDPVVEVAEGRASFGIGSSDILLSKNLGMDIIVLAAIFQHSPQIILVPESSGITTLHELAGKSIMFEAQSTEIEALLRNEGVLDYTKVEHSHNPLDIATGRVDAMTAYTTTEPFFLKHAGVPTRRFFPRQGGIDFYNDCLFVDGKLHQSNPGLVRRFLEASLKGWRYAFERPEKIIDLIIKKYDKNISRAFLEFEMREMRKLVLPELVDVGHINPGRWRHIAETYVSLGLLPKDYSLEGFIWAPQSKEGPSFIGWLLIIGGMALVLFLGLVLPIRRNMRRLRDGQARQQVLFENSHAPIAWIRMDGSFASVNQAFIAFFGYADNQTSTLQDWLSRVIPDQAGQKTMLRLWEEVNGSSDTQGHTNAMIVRCKDGLLKEVSVFARLVGDRIIFMFDVRAEGAGLEEALRMRVAALVEAEGLSGLDVDSLFNSTELENFREHQKQLQVQLIQSQKLESIGTMAGGLAHEINTPLMNMINFSDLIRDRLEMVSCHDHAIDQVKAFAGEIKDEGERIMGIVKNLLAFSHQENESEGMIGMREMIHGLISLIGRLLDKDGIDLTVDISPDLPAILCRPRQIQQALLNLVTNARDALNDRFVGTHPDKKIRILVTSALMDDRIWVRTSIKDHGTGIAKEIQSRVFDPFFTTRPEGKGIGLGLAISYSIIRDHGGSIEIESSEAGPTYFHVWLPAGKERTETLHAG